MKKLFSISILVLAAFLIATSAAFAITVNIYGTDYTSAKADQTYAFINASIYSSDSGDDKINIVDYILNGRLEAGDHTYTLLNGIILNPIETWFANGAVSVILNEIAGYENQNRFGYYLTSNPSTLNQIFTGLDSNGETRSFDLNPAQNFGFYLGVPNTGYTYYTEMSRNTSSEIHAAIFQVDNSNTYIIGFEDLRLTGADADYQDMIVSVTIRPVPEPATVLLLGLGLVGLAGARRFKK